MQRPPTPPHPRAEFFQEELDNQHPRQVDGLVRPRLSFSDQDHLGLSKHPAVRAGAFAALGQHEVQRAGPQACDTRCETIRELDIRIARFLGLPVATTFATAADATWAAFLRLLRPEDDIIIDAGAHPTMFEAANAVGARLHRSPAGSLDAIERRLARLAMQRSKGRLLVALPAISDRASQMAELADLVALTHRYAATLIVDVSQDLACVGQNGGGVMELQGCVGKIDVVIGSFSKGLCANGGFAAFRDPGQQGISSTTEWHSIVLSPVNAGAILAAIELCAGPEGRRRRRHLHGNVLRLRNHLMADGFRVLGHPSPVVPVALPWQSAASHTALLESGGPMVPLLQAPEVGLHAPRWMVHVSSDHGAADIDDLAELMREVFKACDHPRYRLLAETAVAT